MNRPLQNQTGWQHMIEMHDYIHQELHMNRSPFSRIFLNFGSWQTQVKDDGRQSDDGHAHINCVLTHEAINKIGE